jgi:hypothetical protein
MKELEECKQRRRKEELHKNEERIEKQQTRPRRNILRANVTRKWNFQEQEVMI